MGWAGVLYASILWPAIILCIASKKYAALAFIIAMKWVAFIAPVRNLLSPEWNPDLGDSPAYFMAIYTVTAVLIIIFCEFDRLFKITMGLLSLSLIFSYSPYASGYVTLKQALITSEIFGYAQMLAMYGAGGGFLARKLFADGDDNRWFDFMVDYRLSKPAISHTLYNKLISKDAER